MQCVDFGRRITGTKIEQDIFQNILLIMYLHYISTKDKNSRYLNEYSI